MSFGLLEDDHVSHEDIERDLKKFVGETTLNEAQEACLQHIINGVYNLGRTRGWNESYSELTEAIDENARRKILPFLSKDRQRRK